jgi:hypothetical protein
MLTVDWRDENFALIIPEPPKGGVLRSEVVQSVVGQIEIGVVVEHEEDLRVERFEFSRQRC